LSKYLDLILSNEDVTQPKPDPQIYNKAMEFFNLSPSQCLVVEDNPHGLEAARRSGAHVMRVDSVEEVNWENLTREISLIEQGRI
ncbi:MAG: HAD family hydrolase, partial [Bdellovibrionales bacterium]|nr:HAD family hydrolase [Bdellovibrionales bacterium]